MSTSPLKSSGPVTDSCKPSLRVARHVLPVPARVIFGAIRKRMEARRGGPLPDKELNDTETIGAVLLDATSMHDAEAAEIAVMFAIETPDWFA